MNRRGYTFILVLCLLVSPFIASYQHTLSFDIDPKSINPGTGHEYTAPLRISPWLKSVVKSDTNDYPYRSHLVMVENGKELGPAHSVHDTIRSTGNGAYSHWQDSILFSSSDNSDPRTNHRHYGIKIILHFPDWVFYTLLAGLIIIISIINLPGLRAVITHAILLLIYIYRALARYRQPIHLLLRTALVCLLFMVVTYLTYINLPASEKMDMMESSIDHVIVWQQYQRAVNSINTDILFLGDSSCLMGIDFKNLQDELSPYSVRSLCSIAYVGPEGYGLMLRRQLESATNPEYLVLFFHPANFNRDISAESWIEIIDSMGREEIPAKSFLETISLTIQNGLFGSWLFHAMPGKFGTYYGTVWNFAHDVSQYGHALDPGTGLDTQANYIDNTPHTFEYAPSHHSEYAINDLFINSLHRLQQDIIASGLGPEQIYLAIAPVPYSSHSMVFENDRASAVSTIIDILQIGQDQVLPLPISLENDVFSSATHLNRGGKQTYTMLLADILRTRLASNR